MNVLNHNSTCKEAELYYYDFICDKGHQLIPVSITDHIERCHVCQQEVEQLKKILSQTEDQTSSHRNKNRAAVTKWLELHLAYIGKPVTCREVRPFLPGLLDTSVKVRIPTPITVHLEKCQQCREDLEVIREFNLGQDQLWQLGQILTGEVSEELPLEAAKMQQLQRIASRITERPESGVATIYNIGKPAKTSQVSESDGIYAGFPIKVDVVAGEDRTEKERPVSRVDISAFLKGKTRVINSASLIKPAMVAAAIILVVVALFVITPTAKAITIKHIYKAIEKIKNVYIAKFAAGNPEPKQELWVSRELNIYMAKAGNEMVLWDIGNGIRKTKLSDTGTISTLQLTEETLGDIKQKMSGYLGLVPFESMSEIPVDTMWKRVVDEGLEIKTGIEVYDLTWKRNTHDGSLVFYKWRFFVDTETNLPQKTEVYIKLPDNSEYTLWVVIIVENLSISQMQNVLEQATF